MKRINNIEGRWSMETFAKWVQTYQSLIVVVLGIAGWIVNYQLNLKAQRKNLNNQLINIARSDVTLSLRQYIDYLNDFKRYCSDFRSSWYGADDNGDYREEIWYWSNDNWEKEMNKFNKILDCRKTRWSFVLEEYSSLLPEIEMAHNILVNRNKELEKLVIIIQRDLYNQSVFDPEVDGEGEIIMLDAIENNSYGMNEQINLVEDLLVYVQVNCFSKITGNEVPDSKYNEDDDRPKFMCKKTKLVYFDKVSS